MATNDQPEKSLFFRLKDCVLTELRRERGETKKAPCKSRSIWEWTTQEKQTDGVSSSSENPCDEKNYCESSPVDSTDKSTDIHSRVLEKCKNLRYHIKMQDPEAPVCCEIMKTRRLCSSNTRKRQPTFCRCNGYDASYAFESDERC